MIRNPNDIKAADKRIRMLIAGYPGIGKSTLALSAPNPLHIDVDFGIDRIEPQYRKPYIQPASYQEILDDLTPVNVADFDTLTARLNRGEETGRQTELRNEVQSLSVQMKSRQVKRERLYEDYSDGILTAEEYTMMKQRFDEEYQQLNRQLNALLVQQAKLNKTLSSENKWLESMRSVINGGELTRELVVAMVEKVLVYEDADHQKRIEVVLKYQEEFETLRSAWEELKGEGQE